MKQTFTESEKKLIQKLHENEFFFEQVANHTADIIYVMDLDTHTFTYINKRVKEVMGTDNIMLDNIHEDDYWTRMTHLDACHGLKKGQTKEIAVRLRIKNGDWNWFHFLDRPFKFNMHGQVTHILGVARDINEFKLREEQLIAQENMLKGILDACLTYIVLYKAVRNPKGGIEDFEFILTSKSFNTFHNRFDLVGKHVFREYPSIKEKYLPQWAKVVETGQGFDSEDSYRNSVTGKLHNFHLKLEKFGDGLIVVFHDILNGRH
ncbi:MAG TPA: PAS domain S-box protein [Flavobacteriales bacterium]|nr:PAS domain S-box protein [Flavobacteriales bacterium]